MTQTNTLIFHPLTIADALAGWDSGEAVPTVSMGGMGDAYEMVIQIATFELLRAMTTNSYLVDMIAKIKPGEKPPAKFVTMIDELMAHLDQMDPKTGRYALGGMSGAQAGAAKNLAFVIAYSGDWSKVYEMGDRVIYVTKQDPLKLYPIDLQKKIDEDPNGQMADYWRARLAEHTEQSA